MTQEVNKRDSIYIQLFRLLVCSLLLAVLIFCILEVVGTYLLDQYIYGEEYQERKESKYIEDFQKFVQDNHISIYDKEKISIWVREQKILSLYIYEDGIQIYNSDYPEQEVWEEQITLSDYEAYYIVEFSDTDAQVIIFGSYGYSLYFYEFIINLLVSFAIFLFLVLFGIRKKMSYITTLSKEIEILEGGSLHYPVTVKGKDELGALAAGLEDMRISFLELREKETQMVQENQRIVTEMSHDLRTPVTSIMLYTEILKKENENDKAQRKKYIEIIEKKAKRMKQLTDHLFEYSLVIGEGEVELEEPETFSMIFYDLLSETCSYLNQKGFLVDVQVEWTEEKICISETYLMRIMDNITSNLIKYADNHYKITIISMNKKKNERKLIGFMFQNHINYWGDKQESTGIGIQNIKNMMAKMRGECIVEKDGDDFKLTIWFPVIEKDGIFL